MCWRRVFSRAVLFWERAKCQSPLSGVNRLGKLSGLGIGGGQCVEHGRIIPSRKPVQLPGQRQRLGTVAEGRLGRGGQQPRRMVQTVPGVGKIGVAFQGLLEVRHRLVHPPGLEQHDAEVVIGLWVEEDCIPEPFGTESSLRAAVPWREKPCRGCCGTRHYRAGWTGPFGTQQSLHPSVPFDKARGRGCCRLMRHRAGWPGSFETTPSPRPRLRFGPE